MINAALFLRRPLLVTGRPGAGKSTLAYAVAAELKLGPVLRWSISSRSSLNEALYQYDAIGRLQDLNARKIGSNYALTEDDEKPSSKKSGASIGSYIRLGPLGTAMLPYKRPRVLLIDEIDKSDIDLPNDLLNVLEEGQFEIDELARLGRRRVVVGTQDKGTRVALNHGHVECLEFPFVVMTSNGERDFPPAFLRRCLRLDMRQPNPDQLSRIIEAHLGLEGLAVSDEYMREFLDRRERGQLSTDQLLNAIYLATSGARHTDPRNPQSLDDLINSIMRPLADDL